MTLWPQTAQGQRVAPVMGNACDAERALRSADRKAPLAGDSAEPPGEHHWSQDNSSGWPHLLGPKQSNAFGLDDMHGYGWQCLWPCCFNRGWGEVAPFLISNLTFFHRRRLTR